MAERGHVRARVTANQDLSVKVLNLTSGFPQVVAERDCDEAVVIQIVGEPDNLDVRLLNVGELVVDVDPTIPFSK